MTFGDRTVTFVTVTETGEPNSLGIRPKQRTEVPVTGCRHRPLSVEETPEAMTNVATQIWKTTAPPEAAAIAAASTGELKVDGVTYVIIGDAKPFEDMANPFKVTILSREQEG